IDSFGGTQSSTYDGNNFLTRRTYSGQSQELRIDFDNNKEGWTETLTRYSNLAGTNLVGSSLYAYDGAGTITNIQSYDSGSTLLNEFDYALDPVGRVTSVIETQQGTPTTTGYSYDAGGQLTGDGTNSYDYDDNGN